MDDESRAGRGEPAAGGGGEPQSAEGGESGSGGAGSATPNCDMTPLDAVQSACRLSPPSDEMCEAQDTDSWSGCYAGGCTVCTEMVAEYPYYFKWNACCKPNATCSNHDPRKCNQRCPAPSQRDKVPPCFVLEPL